MKNLLDVEIKTGGYQENKDIIKDIHFSVSNGEIVGLIGQNGAGKSTTIKAILGMLREMKGVVSFNGEKKKYGYIPEQPIYYDELTLWEHLELAAAVFEMDRSYFLSRAEYLLDLFRMKDENNHLPNSFSKGMQQKLMIILAFLMDPDIYIIDEPFIGLDPRATKDFLKFITEERDRGKAILMSTHVLDTAEKICDRFVIIEQGNLVANGSLEEIRKEFNLNSLSLLDSFHEVLERI